MIETIREIIRTCEETTGIKFEAELKLNGRLTKVLGRAIAKVHTDIFTKKVTTTPLSIEINKKFAETATKEELIGVVSHEFAHYCCYSTIGNHTHDTKEFKYYCGLLNTSSATSITIKNQIKCKYETFCSCCGKTTGRYTSARANVIKNKGKGYRSACCRSTIEIKTNW